VRRYTHSPLGEEIRAAAGRYAIETEKLLAFRGRSVLIALGYATVDSACCGTGGCGFAFVPGYLVGWKVSRNEKGEAVSEVEPIEDEKEREELRRIIRDTEKVDQVNFW
jgi:hypothetical protein